MSAIEDFCESTTFHGFLDWYTSKNRFWKSIWGVIVVVSLSATVYESFQIFKQYYAEPITTSIKISSTADSDMKFPEITICSRTFVNSSIVERDNLGEFIKAVTSVQGYQLALLMDVKSDESWPQTSSVGESLNFNYEMENVINISNSITYSTEQVVKKCLFASKSCDGIVGIERVFEMKYGTCFLIKVHYDEDIGREGLVLLIDTHASTQNTLEPSLDEGISIRVQTQYDPLQTSVLQAPTGFYSSISMRAVHYSLLQYRGNCSNSMTNQFLTGIPYSQDLCQLECRYNVINSGCGCLPAVYSSHFINKTVRICQSADEINCLTKARFRNSKTYTTCTSQCRPTCDYWEYSTSASLKRFPSRVARPQVANLLHQVNESRMDDFLVVAFIVDQLRIENVEQQFSISCEGFVSQIGGLLGLFMGGSLISIVQLIIVMLQHCPKPHIKKSKMTLRKEISLK